MPLKQCKLRAGFGDASLKKLVEPYPDVSCLLRSTDECQPRHAGGFGRGAVPRPGTAGQSCHAAAQERVSH